MSTPEAVERKIVAKETEVERVKKQLEDVIGDRDRELLLRQELAALRQELPALQQQKLLLMQQQAAAAAAAAPPGAFSKESELVADVAELKQQIGALQQQHQQREVFLSIAADLFDYDEDNITAITIPAFKNALIKRYSKEKLVSGVKVIKCMLTGKYLPKHLVIAAHLWKRQWARFTRLMGFADIHDEQNGLLLFKPVEWAFDTSRLTFVYNADFQAFEARILDQSMCSTPLVAKLDELLSKDSPLTSADAEVLQHAVGSLTFGDLHGRMLVSDKKKQHPQPFKRVLYFHSRRSLLKAAERNWQHEQLHIAEVDSPGTWKQNVEYFFQRLEEAEPEQAAANAEAALLVASEVAARETERRAEQLQAVAAPAPQAQKTVVQQTDMPPGMGKAARKNFKRHQNRKKKNRPLEC